MGGLSLTELLQRFLQRFAAYSLGMKTKRVISSPAVMHSRV